MNKYWHGVLMTLIAAVCWGIMSPIAKVLSSAGISLMSVMAFRALFVVVAVGPYIYFTKGSGVFRPDRDMLCFYLLSGILSVVFSGGGFLMSLKYLSVPEALILHYTFPLVTLLGSLYITHEKPTFLQVVSGFLIIAGVYLGMVGGEKTFSGLSVPGLMWGGLAIIGISGQALVARRVCKGQETDQLVLLFFAHLLGGIVLALGKSIIVGWEDILNFTSPLFGLMVFQAFCGSLLAYGLFYTALKYLPAATVSLLCTLEIVVAVGLTSLLLKQPPSIQEIIGCTVIIIAIVCATVRTSGPEDQNM
ncbi:MAG: DMT family transporter [Synergistaceae bacterium]|jgi:drug/metabolite transporter (DMT)-like permease|nr:DMT family transporter [Synergistaceae bacterium]MDD2350364.1 DMT family transporter [Synergistaceae bacterium]MDD3672153.1 DMT family transporter [Synergistaceae bacterium]MDD4704662.1 DMT family transporter [Synergistaceae bacterium]MDY0283181.1 DMT family transporter [Synergistaceae bacterium]